MNVLQLKTARKAIRLSISRRDCSGMLCVLGASMFAVGCGTRAAQANTIYNLLSFPSVQNGYSVTGTITTDGRLGTLAYSDIIATSITAVTNGVSTYQNLQPDHVYGSTGLFATSTGLFLRAVPVEGPSPNFSIESLGNDVVSLRYDYAANAGTGYVDYFSSVNHPTASTNLWRASGNNLLNLTGQPWQIAQSSTVPEPSASLLLGIGVAMLSGMRRLLRCGARPAARHAATP
jgi:hypothetical protein